MKILSMATVVKNNLIAEIVQHEDEVRLTIFKILRSKRLLSDHLELIQECLIDLDNQSEKYSKFNVTKSVTLSAIAGVTTQVLDNRWKLLKHIIPVFAIGYTSLVVVKYINITRNRLFSNPIGKFINVINSYEMCIKRNIAYYREVQQLKTNCLYTVQFNKENQMVCDCITSIINVTKSLYDSIKHLENYPLPEKYNQIYQPLEDLKDCEYFHKPVNQFTASNIKDFYNIFLYFQSQFLTRLALAITYNNKLSKNYLNDNIGKLMNLMNLEIIKENNVYKSLTTNVAVKTQLEKYNAKEKQLKESVLQPIQNVKSYSLDFTTRIIAIANECRHLDQNIQSIVDDSDLYITPSQMTQTSLMNLLPVMKQIEDSLLYCQDDYQRLTLAYHQFLHKRFKISQQITDNQIVPTDEKPNLNESHVECIELCDIETNNDNDYFAIFDQDDYQNSSDVHDKYSKEYKNSKYYIEEDIKHLDVRIVKKHFKPVLKQLKERINPINKSMMEREHKFLLSRGINLKKLMSVDNNAENNNNTMDIENDSSAESDDSKTTIEKKKSSVRKSKKNKYDDVREFLQEKHQLRILPIIPLQPPNSLVHEDILE